MINEYRYEISVECRYNDYRVFIDTQHIKSLVIDYDYDNKNMPICILSLLLDKKVNDIIINNKTTAKIYLIVYKYISNADYKVKEVYIEEEFVYFVTDNTNKTNTLDYNNTDESAEKDLVIPTLLGLVKQELVDTNKQNIMNTIFKNSRVIDMICRYSENRKLLIEPPNKKIVDQLVITPISTYTDYIKYLDNNVNIYEDSYYRLFYDYDKTYIMSGRGNAVYAQGENKYPIVFDIYDNFNINSKLQGMSVEDSKYKITVDELDIIIQKDDSTSVLYNNIIGIDSSGSKVNTDISSDRTSMLSKTVIYRYNTDNTNNNHSLKSSIENTEKIINIVKNNLDTSIFTINKEYIINYHNNEDYNGNFILLKKKEIFSKEEDHFAITNLFTFSKVKK